MKTYQIFRLPLVAILLILISISNCPVNASTIIDEDLSEWIDTSGTRYTSGSGGISNTKHIDRLYITEISAVKQLSYVVVDVPGNRGQWLDDGLTMDEGRHDFTYTMDGINGNGAVYVSRQTNALGQIISTKFTIFFLDWHVNELSGLKTVILPFGMYYGTVNSAGSLSGDGLIYPGSSTYTYPSGIEIKTLTVSADFWQHKIIAEEDSNSYHIILNRSVNGELFSSIFNITKDGAIVYYTDKIGINEELWFLKSEIDNIAVISPSDVIYNYDLSSITPPITDNTIYVYIRNSQTGAAIANSRCAIDALVGGDYYPVVNQTEPSGVFSVTLQPTGGGMPNPDSYRLIATADGYNNPMQQINFTVDEYTSSLYCYLDPIAGGPTDENKTFIDFFVRDLSANPISGATVNFGGYTLLTNSQGYTVFEVGKNATYTYTVSKSGYGSLTGNAVIGSNARHTINAVIAPAVTPTTPTPIPTSTPISPTPTMTAPTGEPVSNWLEWFAAHFGMILGGGAEIGKIFMWLCFSVPVGVYVGKEAKAGAAGFLAGAGIVTLFFVLIGWVPIWLLVLLALIIGLLYAKVFNNSDNGGGR